MNVCVTSEGDKLSSSVDPRFGRSRYFIIVDTEYMQFEAIQNPNVDAAGGAGIQSAQLVAEKGVKRFLNTIIGEENACRVKPIQESYLELLLSKNIADETTTPEKRI